MVMGCGVAALTFGRSALGQASDGFQPLPTKITVTSNHLTTPVMINGKGPFHFVIDTGADRSVIADDLARALHMPFGREVIVQGIIQAVEAQSVPVAEMKFGQIVCDNLQMPVLSRKQLQADGFLGLDAIGEHRVLFDFRRRTLRVGEGLPPEFLGPNASNETRIAAPGYNGHLRSAECRVDGISTVAFIDTGAEVSVGNQALRTALMNLEARYAGVRDVELTGITGGSRTGRVIKVDTILFGDLEFSGCEIAAADLDVFNIWGLAERPAMLIGLNFLREFQTVSIDFHRKEYRLKLATSPWVNHHA
jgi:predicted aspartyl protease